MRKYRHEIKYVISKESALILKKRLLLIMNVDKNSTSDNTLDTFEIYDIESNTWSSGGKMPEPKEKIGIELYEDKILIIGGIKDRTTISHSTNINVFNLKANK